MSADWFIVGRNGVYFLCPVSRLLCPVLSRFPPASSLCLSTVILGIINLSVIQDPRLDCVCRTPFCSHWEGEPSNPGGYQW